MRRTRSDTGLTDRYRQGDAYTSLLHALKVHDGVPAVLQLLQDGESGDDSLPSPRVHAARLLYAIASRREPGFGRDEFGIDACELINAHGRLIRLPLPQPLVKRAVPEISYRLIQDGYQSDQARGSYSFSGLDYFGMPGPPGN